jgi:hypothetical protein
MSFEANNPILITSLFLTTMVFIKFPLSAGLVFLNFIRKLRNQENPSDHVDPVPISTPDRINRIYRINIFFTVS